MITRIGEKGEQQHQRSIGSQGAKSIWKEQGNTHGTSKIKIHLGRDNNCLSKHNRIRQTRKHAQTYLFN